MSAMTGIGDAVTIFLRASTSFSRGTATRTRSEPASATLWICSIVAERFAVSVLVIVWTATGAPPPIGTSFTQIWRFEAMRQQGYRGRPYRRLRRTRSVVVEGVDLVRVLLDDGLALELHRRRELVTPGFPVHGEDLELLHLLHAGELLVGLIEAVLDLGDELLVLGERLQVVAGVMLLRPALRGLGVERQQRAYVLALVADGDRLAHQRDLLQPRLDVGRREVLTRRRDDELLLAVDDLQVTVVVELADVAGLEETVLGHGLRGLVGQVAVALHHDGPLDQHLAVLGELDVDARAGRTHAADLDPLARVARARARRLRHPPQLGQRDAEGVEELDHLGRRRRGADVARLELVEAEMLAQVGEDLLVGLRHPLRQLVGDLLLALLESHLLQRSLERLLDRLSL